MAVTSRDKAFREVQFVLELQMGAEVHALVQYTGDQDRPFCDAVDDDMPAGGKYAMRCRQFRSPVADLRMLPNGQQRLVEYVAVFERLSLAPSFERVLEDLGKVVFSARGEKRINLFSSVERRQSLAN